jgi:hypothetical protein
MAVEQSAFSAVGWLALAHGDSQPRLYMATVHSMWGGHTFRSVMQLLHGDRGRNETSLIKMEKN